MVVCTGQSSVAQRVRGLRLGADDWVTKPCHPEELIARIEAVVRRRKRADVRVEKGPVVIGEVEIRADQFQAFVGGASVELTRREFELIQLLAEAEGQVLQREEIYQRVWGYAMVHGDRSVDVFVRKLRSKLERVSPSWRYIHTHFGIGYRFSAEPVERAGGRRRSAVPGARAAPPRPRRRPTNLGSGVGPDRNKNLRNFAIVIALAVVVWKVPGGGTAAATISNILTIAFVGGPVLLRLPARTWSTARRSSGSRSASAGCCTARWRWPPSRWWRRSACGTRAGSAPCSGSPCSAPRAGRCTASGARTRRIEFGTLS